MTATVRAMFRHLLPYKWAFTWAQIAMLAGTAAGLAFPWTVRNVFAALFADQPVHGLLTAVVGLAAVSVVREVGNYLKGLQLSRIGQKIVRDLRSELYTKLLELSLSYYDQRSSGDIASNMSNDINVVQQGIAALLTRVLHHALTLVAVTVLLVRIDHVLAGAVFITLPLIMLTAKRMGDRVRAISRTTQERLADLMSIIQQSVSGIDIIQAFVLQKQAQELFRDQNEQVLARTLDGVRTRSRAGLIIGLLNALFLLLIIGLGAYRVTAGALEPEDLIAFILYSEMVAGPISMLAGVYVEVSKATAAYERIQSVLERSSSIQHVGGKRVPERIQGAVEFCDVSFAYDGQHAVLHSIDLTIEAGETVALVGPSGAGKSTLAKLVPRFYDPIRGEVRIDGIPIVELDLAALRGTIAIVPQDTYLFGLSIAENIACGKPDASREDIESAARLANAHAFIMEQREGYETEIGERGVRLSGGQRQRLALARAFLKDPRILILDEATSSLDSRTERSIQDALEVLMQGRTTLIIAHRLATIERADRIVVLRDGRIHAVGPHRTLMGSCPFYRDLYEAQFRNSSASE